jgi:RNA polymerase primary sigma factor
MRQLKITKSITNRENASLDRYLAEIGRQKMIDAEEEANLARLIREGDKLALNKLVSANLRFVVSVAKQYQSQGMSLSDLISEGNVGLIKAATRFDETRGFKFISYAVWWIRQSIIQAVAEKSRIVRLPLNKIGTITKIRKTQAKLEQVLERLPEDDEVAYELAMSASDVTLAISVSKQHVSSDAPVSSDSDVRWSDLSEDVDSIRPDAFLLAESLSIDLERTLQVLSTQEKDIVISYYGIGLPAESLEQIAQKYELTRERVRQIKEKAVRRLRSCQSAKPLKAYL